MIAPRILLVLICLLPSTLAATPMTRLLPVGTDHWTDPYHLPSLPGTTISLFLSGFLEKPNHFEPVCLLHIVSDAQAAIVQRLIEVPGDAPIAQPNLEWQGYYQKQRIVLRVNHNVDKGLRWSDLSQAIRAIVEFGVQTNYVTVKRISVFDARRGELAQAELVPFKWTESLTNNSNVRGVS